PANNLPLQLQLGLELQLLAKLGQFQFALGKIQGNDRQLGTRAVDISRGQTEPASQAKDQQEGDPDLKSEQAGAHAQLRVPVGKEFQLTHGSPPAPGWERWRPRQRQQLRQRQQRVASSLRSLDRLRPRQRTPRQPKVATPAMARGRSTRG